jgi:glycosyltransferase involved in cell wall biosynthesis
MTGRPLKVLYVIHDARRGGVQSVMLQVIAALDRSRVEPVVLFPFDGPCAEELRRQGVTVHTCGEQTSLVWRFKRYLFIPRLIGLSREADLVHLNSVKLAAAALAASLAGARVVYHLHELAGRIGPLLRAAIGRADCAAFCSRTCADHFAQVPARRKAVLVNAVRLPGKVLHRGEAALPRIVMLGSINPGKGQDLLVEAFARLSHPAAELHLYGNVGMSARRYVERIRERSTELGLSGRLFMHSPTDDVPAVLAGATILVHTSWRESFGMALVEGMAAGLPVVAHDLGGMREVVADGENGFLVPAGDISALAERLDRLLADPSLRAMMGDAGRQRVAERFDIALRIEEYHSLYQELAEMGTVG